MADIKDITTSSFDSDVLGAEGLIMVYYYAPWCKPCDEMTEVVSTVADEVSEKMSIAQINTDQEGEIVSQQGISVLPTIQVFRSAKILETFRGPHTKLELLGQLSGIITQEGGAEPGAQEPEDQA